MLLRRPAILGAALLLAIASTLLPLSRPATADTSPPVAPSNLSMTVTKTGKALPAGGWTRYTQLDFHFQIQASAGPLTPEVEIEPMGVPFTGQSNFTGRQLAASGQATVHVSGLINGKTYHWQGRVVDASGVDGPWGTFSHGSASADLGVDQTPPTRPLIHSPTDPNQNRWYHTRAETLRWSSSDSISGIAGYTYAVEKSPHVIPPGSVSPQAGVRLGALSDGVWFLAIRSVDRAGNWSPTATFKLQLDRQAPRLSWLSPARFTFNPYQGSTSVRVTVNKDSRLKLGLYRVGASKPSAVYSFAHVRAGQILTLTWNGRDGHGKIAPKGYYYFSAEAVDRAENTTRTPLGGIALEPAQAFKSPSGQMLFPNDGKRIIVSLSQERLYAYDGTRLVVETPVTTGNPNLPTPPGSYHILARYHPFEFISPWPLGSPYYYAPSLSQYAMLFRSGGYFLHDAPWRSVFGPGSNGPGQPGSNFGGTHGCVNIPAGPTLTLWNWAPIGTRVDVVL